MGPEGCSGVSVEMSEMRVEQNSGTFLVHRRKTGLAGALRGMGESKVPMYCMLCCFVLIRQLYLFIGSRIVYNPYVVGFGYPVGWMTCCVLELGYYLTRIRGRN